MVTATSVRLTTNLAMRQWAGVNKPGEPEKPEKPGKPDLETMAWAVEKFWRLFDGLYIGLAKQSSFWVFWILFGTVMIHFIGLEFGPVSEGYVRCTQALMRKFQYILAAVRLVTVFPFACISLSWSLQNSTGWVQLLAALSSVWGVFYVVQVVRMQKYNLRWNQLAADEERGAELVVDEERGLEIMRSGRRVVPGDARIQAADSSSVRSCSVCADAVPNARCRPCGHATTCEPCLLRWASVAITRCKCPICSKYITGYDVAAEPGQYFLHTFAEEGGNEDAYISKS